MRHCTFGRLPSLLQLTRQRHGPSSRLHGLLALPPRREVSGDVGVSHVCSGGGGVAAWFQVLQRMCDDQVVGGEVCQFANLLFPQGSVEGLAGWVSAHVTASCMHCLAMASADQAFRVVVMLVCVCPQI